MVATGDLKSPVERRTGSSPVSRTNQGNLMKRYFSINGTATRSEYWGVQLLAVGAMVALWTVTQLLSDWPVVTWTIYGASTLVYIWLLAATSIRRCDNAGISAWWTLATILPWIGFVVWIVIGCIKPDVKYSLASLPKP